MKIISKRKDYYDHLVAKFGFDETRVYDRRNPKGTIFYKEDNRHLIAIAGKIYPVICKNGKCYHKKNPSLSHEENWFFRRWEGTSTKLNEFHRQPVVVGVGCENRPYIPNLAELGFAAVIPAEDMYRMIYDYLGWLKDNPVPPNTQTDKEKVVAHGFDAKRSFRPKIKK